MITTDEAVNKIMDECFEELGIPSIPGKASVSQSMPNN